MKTLIFLKKIYSKRLIELSEFGETIQLLSFSFLSFVIPVFIGKPQLVVGSLVNLLILSSTYTMKGWKNFPTIIIPSLAAISHGLLFGSLTIYLFYLLPFIWLGNFLLSFTLKLTLNKNMVLRVLLPALTKFAAISIPTFVFVQMHFVPKNFLNVMSINQLFTALIGGILATILKDSLKKINNFS